MNGTTMFELSAYVNSSLSCAFIVVIFSITLIAVLSRNAGGSQVRRLPPGPPGWPIVGNLPEMMMNRPTSKWIHRVMKEMKTDIACFRFTAVHVVAITSDEIVREALRDKDAIFADRVESYAVEYLSAGYKSTSFARYGDQWKKMRRVMSSEIMSAGRLNWLLGQRTVEADNLIAYVHSLYKQSEMVNVRDIARTYCHSMIMRLMFGRRNFGEATDDGGLGPTEKEHLDAVFEMMGGIFGFSVSDYVPWLRGLNVGGQEKKIRAMADAVVKYHEPIVDERIELWRQNGGKAVVGDWLDVFVTLKDEDGKPFLTKEEIVAQCTEIIVAAIDNTTNNMEWVMAEMLNQPEILEKAKGEVDKVVGKERLVGEDDVHNLNYIKACIKETFRLRPFSRFVLPHVTIEDTTLAGYFIPKGSHILIDRVELGRNPKIWEKPDVFSPERHLNGTDQVTLADQDMRLVTFSAGRRSCVAEKLGTAMAVMFLARLLQGFTWTIPPVSDSGPGRVELIELSETSLFMAKPPVVRVEPRLPPHLYPRVRH